MIEVRAVDAVEADCDGLGLFIEMGEDDQFPFRGVDKLEILVPGGDGGVPADSLRRLPKNKPLRLESSV